MTYKEKIATIAPKIINPNSGGGVIGCPRDYTELHSTLHSGNDECMFPHTTCEECWDQEYVEEVEDVAVETSLYGQADKKEEE